MSPLDWREIEERVSALWGRSPKWAHAEKLLDEIAYLSFDVALEVVHSIARDPERTTTAPPPPAEVIAKTRARQPPIELPPSDETCRHDQHRYPYEFATFETDRNGVPKNDGLVRLRCRFCGGDVGLRRREAVATPLDDQPEPTRRRPYDR